MTPTPETALYTLLYDAACPICSGQARNVRQFDRKRRIELLDINSSEARQRFPRIGPEDAQREMYLAAPGGKLYRGVEAVRQTLLLLPGARGLGALMYLPGAMALAKPLYRWVARNRYRLSGREKEACEGTCEPRARAEEA
jgi:predicted DCC family thiol-disulfide oxidoreductase YuxK